MFSLNLMIKAHTHQLCSMFCLGWLFLILSTFSHLVTSYGCPLYGDRSEAFSPGRSTVVKKCNLSSSSLGHGNFKLTDGRVVSCSSRVSTLFDPEAHISTEGHNNYAETSLELGFSDVFTTPPVEIKPLLLDWGLKNVHYPSLELLTVKNIDTDTVLTIFDPYSSNSQFYPCNFTEISLGPGETTSICFVFFPSELGRSSGQLVLQTSFGGFLIWTTGFGLESPYSIKPLLTSRAVIQSLSLFNPLNEALSVNEISYWIYVSSGNISHSSKAICTIQSLLDLENAENCLPEIEIRPRNWKIDPRKTEPVMELDLSDNFEGKIVGAFCMQLTKLSEKKMETIVVPLEVDLNRSSSSDEKGLVSASLEASFPFKEVDTREVDKLVFLDLLDGSNSNHVQSIEFDLSFPFFCSRLMIKEVHAKNMGDLTLDVKRVGVSGSACSSDGFLVSNCEGFSLRPGESVLLKISYQNDFSSGMMQRDLELALSNGVLINIPLKASLPIYCKRPIFLMRMKKAMAVLSFLLICLLFSRLTANPSKMLSISSNTSSKGGSDPQNSTNKEKKRRRRKKKSSCMGLFEVPSSQSGNSTPSSPFSPAEIIKPNEQRDKSISSYPFMSDEKSYVRKFAGRPVLLPSATFPSATKGTNSTTSAPCSPFLASSSPIAPHARAPGTRRRDQENGSEPGEKMGAEKNLFTYDIWGDHLFGISLNCRSKPSENVSIENNSESFFVRDPQTLMSNSLMKTPASPYLEGGELN